MQKIMSTIISDGNSFKSLHGQRKKAMPRMSHAGTRIIMGRFDQR
jgi:hypothetical protein